MVNNPGELEAVAKAILERVEEPVVITLTGDLGAGKTTLVQAFCKVLGVEEAVSSPSFSLVNEYRYLDAEGVARPVYHIDLYRLNDLEEALDIGLPEYIDSGEWCFIEWPEIAESLLPEDAMALQLTLQPDGSRKILSL
ncbi:MAG: tRNA (adenosine(37)-N6)-threonylcarbamoyltransferase complex ATPase subunit type 1 TsaE [Phyllobacteriaceae bacterium]|nr:tRNA (adenosine(37)-N6)-threonylcarbamoyltransferase complex ATPase subunit type 1 TsaE [Phyllobacteriaceae bacterium]